MLLGRNFAHDGLAAPLLGHEAVLGELLHDPVGVGVFLIDLVHRHEDGDIGSLSVVDGLHGLGHDTVICRHHQNGNIRDHSAAGTHGRKRLMARRIQKRDGLAVNLHLIGADVLGNAAGLAGGNGRIADGIQQRGLAVVHVAHDHHNGSAGNQILGPVLRGVDELFLDSDHNLLFHLAAKLLGHKGGGIKVDDLAQRGHDAVFHQALDHLCAGLFHAAGQLTHADLIGNLDLEGGFLGDLKLELAHFLRLILPPLVGKHLTALTSAVVAELFLAALLGHALATLTAKVLKALVILRQIHVAALAGVHQLLLRYAGGGLGSGRGLAVLLLGLLHHRLRGLLSLLLGRRLLRLLRHGGLCLCRLCGLGGRCLCLMGGLCLGGRLRLGRGRAFRLLRLVGIDCRNAGNLIVLGQMLEDDGQLLVLQRLHIALGGLAVLAKDIGDHLCGEAEVPRHITYSVFFNSQIKHLVYRRSKDRPA